MPKYQGSEIQSVIQAPTKDKLNKLVRGMRGYSKRHGMGPIKVLEKGSDPDGGFRATITAHNVNPFKWVKEKIEARGGGAEAREWVKGGEKEKRGERREFVKEVEKVARVAEEKLEREEERKRRKEVEEARKAAAQTESLRVARQVPKERELEEIETAGRRKALREAKPGVVRTIATGASRIGMGLGKAGIELLKTKRATRVARKYTAEGELLEEEIEREPGLFTTPGRAGLYGDLGHLRRLTTPGFRTAGFQEVGSFSRLREAMLPRGTGRLSKAVQPIQMEAEPTLPEMTEKEEKVYEAIKGGARTKVAIAELTELKSGQVIRAITSLEKKGLLVRR